MTKAANKKSILRTLRIAAPLYLLWGMTYMVVASSFRLFVVSVVVAIVAAIVLAYEVPA